MARLARKQMADMRAMEEEAERVNPVMSGKGATPSMGLSQIRGGRKKKSLDAQIVADEEATPSLYIKEMDEMAEMPSGEYDGGAKHRGALLGSFISKMKGGAYLKEFMAGMGTNTGRYEGEGAMSGAGMVVGAGKLEMVHHSDSDEGCGGKRMKKVKRVVGAGDGRRKRAEVVKKVMAQKGLSMIEASKYVKEHGLY